MNGLQENYENINFGPKYAPIASNFGIICHFFTGKQIGCTFLNSRINVSEQKLIKRIPRVHYENIHFWPKNALLPQILGK